MDNIHFLGVNYYIQLGLYSLLEDMGLTRLSILFVDHSVIESECCCGYASAGVTLIVVSCTEHSIDHTLRLDRSLECIKNEMADILCAERRDRCWYCQSQSGLTLDDKKLIAVAGMNISAVDAASILNITTKKYYTRLCHLSAKLGFNNRNLFLAWCTNTKIV
ncbi:hypothetical protein [Enterobacter kobei]|uniref:hypothetical protein n=1 Tax=Enterobacter kobei TaxID=208224 RepID=UPI003F568438